jgi:transcriptional regulator with PAS, ATPase and Fis domain
MPEVRFPVLVGRDAEVAVLERAVARAARGESGVVFVLGEAGVGKTPLASAAASAARRGRDDRAARSGGALPAPVPYRPLAEALL